MTEFRIEIDGDWTAREMHEQLEALTFFHDAFYLASQLYSIGRTAGGIIIPGTPRVDTKEVISALASEVEQELLFRFAGDGVELRVARIYYASPGVQDFLGIAKVVQEVLQFIRGLITIGQEKRKSELALEEYKQKIMKMKLENLSSFLRTLRENGVPDDQIKLIMENFASREDLFIRLTAEEKVVTVQSGQMDQAA
jgi:hypothetical protein